MASNTKVTRFRRMLRRRRMGMDRKKLLAKVGSTIAFALHTPASHANAPEDQLPKAE